ncbi:MAG: hypothetical protein LBF01_00980, partial [Bacteroidales bacterium]|nr:hypothetical protein [Bacteroidales bacterium]
MRIFFVLLSSILFSIGGFVNGTLKAQSAYLDMTIVESSDYNNPIGVFSYDEFQNQFKITTPEGETYNADI